ncbi:Na+/H+ antiporter subunit A [Pengzhenrongella sicca]|uniref:Na+/H+ antiporter subunit A n=1 Tax=Pengzhenrongella sicca TaxID=2819238 RepID=A0A8A4ZBH6_9MICO|nr:Na+/H+ antiporter subunit A [Pengzhenrongella sicca]QTE29340.1 Na+/H+ antiporter subunit A [Pengzhenrongella sicca]
MLALLAAHVVMALAAPALVRWLGRRAYLVLALAPASAAAWALAHTSAVLRGEGPVELTEWVPGLHLELAFRLDTLSWLMVVLVGGVGALVLVYSAAYFSATAGGLGRFGGVLVAFAGAMLGLVVADNLLLLYVFWELTTVLSYLLIGHYADRKASRRAAMQAIIITTAGGLAMLVGFILIGAAAGTYQLSAVIADPPGGTAVSVAVVLVLLGAATKSALIPVHFWLPAAMAAPTPVSAYLHAAAMVKAGVYLVARFAPAYSGLTGWQVMIVTLGCGTLLLGGYRALRQHDLKLILAFGTVSQLGLMVLLVGLGTRAAALAGLAMIGAHAMFKASLFLVVGVIDAATGTRDLRRLSGVGRALPVTAVAAALATASMIGLPPFAGYVAKEAALEAIQDDAGWTGVVVLVSVVVGSALTVAYGLRLLWGAFATKGSVTHPAPAPGTPAATGAAEPPAITRPPALLVGPALLLAVLGLAVALLPQLGESLLAPYADTYPRGEPSHLVLWAGLTPTLALTLLILATGAGAFALRRPIERFQAAAQRAPEADAVYRRAMRRLDDFSADVTGLTQRGSLPVYLGGILVVFVALAGTALVRGTTLPTQVRAWDSVGQLIAGALVVVSAILAARSRRRLKAVVLLGISGYGVAMLFLLHGAPDLALTQVLVETITLVVFVLVLRRLPAYFSDRPLAASRWVRLALGVAVGVTVAGLVLVAPGARIHLPQSIDFPAEALAFGGGENVVNVILVDIRAWDTMGEIAVLLVAATGVASLIFLQRRSGELHRVVDVDDAETPHPAVWGGESDPMTALRRIGTSTQVHEARSDPGFRPAAASAASGSRAWLRAERTLSPQRRSVIFEVVTRLLFHTMIVFAMYLLFAGHNAPGGGFAAGLVVGIALIVRYLAGGRYELGEAAPVHPGLLLGSGLFLSAGVGLAALVVGGEVLQSVIVDLHIPVIGTIHLVTSLFFDLGVFLVVLGLVLDVLRSLGAEIDRQGEAVGADDPAGDLADDPADHPQEAAR